MEANKLNRTTQYPSKKEKEEPDDKTFEKEFIEWRNEKIVQLKTNAFLSLPGTPLTKEQLYETLREADQSACVPLKEVEKQWEEEHLIVRRYTKLQLQRKQEYKLKPFTST